MEISARMGLVVCAFFAAPIWAADITVAPGPGALAAAIADASDGDTLILPEGTYAGDVLIDKALTLRVETGAAVSYVPGVLTIDGAGIRVTLQGLTFDGAVTLVQADEVNILENRFMPGRDLVVSDYATEEGNGIPIAVPDDGVLDESIETLLGQLDLSGLESGRHRVAIRVRDLHGSWSFPIAQSFLVPSAPGFPPTGPARIVSARVWFDGGEQDAETMELTVDGGAIPDPTAIARHTAGLTGLSPGRHSVHVSLEDEYGGRSVPLVQSFLLAQPGQDTGSGPRHLVAAQYRIDDGPFEAAMAADGAFGGLIETIDEQVSLAENYHRVRVRFLDEAGRWSGPVQEPVGSETDTDGNGLPDLWERRWFGAIGQDPNADPDEDGSTNREEHENGTNPTVPDLVTDVVETASFSPDFGDLDGMQVGGDLVLDFCYQRTGDDQGFTVDDLYDAVFLVRDQQVVAMRQIPGGGYYDFCAGSTLWQTPVGEVVSSWADAFGGMASASFQLVLRRRDGRLRGSVPVALNLQDELEVSVTSDTDFPASGPDLDVTFEAVDIQGGTQPYSYDWSYVYDWDPEITSRKALGGTESVVASLGLEPFPGRFWGWGAVPVNLAVSDAAGRVTYVQTIAVVDRQSRVGNPALSGSASRLKDGVDVVSGNFHHAVTDLIVKGRGPDFRLARFYNSDRGGEWQLNYDLTLRMTGANGNREARIRREDGRDQTFYQGNDGDWYAVDIGSFDRLVEQPDGAFHLYTKGQIVYRFVDGHLDRVSDRRGRALSMLRDAQGRLKAVLDALGRRYDFSYDGAGNLIQVRDFTGRAVDYGYDANGMLTSVTNPRDAAHPELDLVRYHYLPEDPSHDEAATYLERIVDARGNATHTIEYDEEWGQNVYGAPVLSGLRVVRLTDALGGETAFDYEGMDAPEQGVDLTVVTPPVASNAVAFALDGGGRVLGKIDAYDNPEFEREVRRAYQGVTDPRRIAEKGLAAVLTNARGYETEKTYSADGRGNLASIRDAKDRTMSIDWEATGTGSDLTNLDVPAQVTTAGDSTCRLTYTDDGQIETLIDPKGAEIRMSYSGGDLAAVTDARGNTSRYTRDAAGNVLTITDALGNVARNGYDLLGRRIAQTDARGAETRYGYDLHGNLLTLTDALDNATHYEYDGNDNRVRRTDAKGYVTEYVYDAKNRRVETRWSVGGVAYSRRYGYDDMDRVAEVTDANGRADATGYDPLGRVSTETDALGQVTRFEYDANGNPTRVKDPEGRSVRTD